jgi:hypothetical protein
MKNYKQMTDAELKAEYNKIISAAPVKNKDGSFSKKSGRPSLGLAKEMNKRKLVSE